MGEQSESPTEPDVPKPDSASTSPSMEVRGSSGEFGAAWAVVGILLSGMLTWGGIGWLVDQWLDTSFLLPTGLIVGSAAGSYIAYKRFGEDGSTTESTTDGDE